MRFTFRPLLTALTVTSLLSLSVGAKAQTIVQEFVFPPPPATTTLTNWSTNFSFNAAAPTINGAELTGIEYELSGMVMLNFSVDNDNPVDPLFPDDTFDFTPSGNATIQLRNIPGVTGGVIQVIPLAQETITLEGDNGDLGTPEYTGPDGITSTANGTANLLANLPTSSFNLYTSGPINLNLRAIGSAGVQGPGNFQSNAQTNAGARVRLTYRYGVIPEPTTLALFAPMVLGGLTLVRRRKSA